MLSVGGQLPWKASICCLWMLQSNSAKAHLSQPEPYTPASMSILYRGAPRLGLWSGIPRIAGHSSAFKAFQPPMPSCVSCWTIIRPTAQRDPLIAKADSSGDGSMSPSQPAQETQDLTACKEDIVSLIQAIFSHFLSYDLTSVNTPGYGSFEDIALAFGLPYEGFLNNKFKVGSFCCCCPSASQALLFYLLLPM